MFPFSELIDSLKKMGAQVRNPHIYDSDLREERLASGSKEPRKIILFRAIDFPKRCQFGSV